MIYFNVSYFSLISMTWYGLFEYPQHFYLTESIVTYVVIQHCSLKRVSFAITTEFFCKTLVANHAHGIPQPREIPLWGNPFGSRKYGGISLPNTTRLISNSQHDWLSFVVRMRIASIHVAWRCAKVFTFQRKLRISVTFCLWRKSNTIVVPSSVNGKGPLRMRRSTKGVLEGNFFMVSKGFDAWYLCIGWTDCVQI